MKSDWNRDRAIVKVCYGLGSGNLARGIELVKPSKRRTGRNRNKSLAYGYLALVAAKKDKALASELLEHGVQIQIEEAEKYNRFNNYTSRAAIVALLAQIGRDIRCPDVPGLVLRAMSLRLTRKEEFNPRRVREANASLAFCLTYVDVDTARSLIEPVIEWFIQPRDPTKAYGYSDKSVVWTLAAIDPARAAEIILAMPDDDPKDSRGRKATALLRLINFLVTEPERRRDYVMSQYNFWIPGVSDE